MGIWAALTGVFPYMKPTRALMDRTSQMTPTEYEALVAAHFTKLGYLTRQTALSGDYGVDVFAHNNNERVAIQVKLYGHTTRRVNRQMVMELHGAKDYFDCDRAVIATNGEFLPDAIEVAEKLGIEVLLIAAAPDSERQLDVRKFSSLANSPTAPTPLDSDPKNIDALTFDQIWSDHVVPLAGQVLHGKGTRSNTVEKVDWAGLHRISSNGQKSYIHIEIFRLAINHILRHGSITRDEINQNYAKRASSGVVLILSYVPHFRLTERPLTLHLIPKDSVPAFSR